MIKIARVLMASAVLVAAVGVSPAVVRPVSAAPCQAFSFEIKTYPWRAATGWAWLTKYTLKAYALDLDEVSGYPYSWVQCGNPELYADGVQITPNSRYSSSTDRLTMGVKYSIKMPFGQWDYLNMQVNLFANGSRVNLTNIYALVGGVETPQCLWWYYYSYNPGYHNDHTCSKLYWYQS